MAADSAFGWISDVLYYFASWFPHPFIVIATHGAVKFQRGWKVKVLTPGFYWYVPALTECYSIPVVVTTMDLPVQSGVTSDMKSVAIGGIIRYSVTDIESVLVNYYDITEVIRDVCLATYNEFVAEHTFSELQGLAFDEERDNNKSSGRHRVNVALTRRVRKNTREYGINVIRAQLTHFSPSRTLVLVGGGIPVTNTVTSTEDEA